MNIVKNRTGHIREIPTSERIFRWVMIHTGVFLVSMVIVYIFRVDILAFLIWVLLKIYLHS